MNSFIFLFNIELNLILRRSQEWLYPLIFFCIVIVCFPLAFSPDPMILKKFIVGGVWIASMFTNLLSAQNFFFTDCEDGYLEQSIISQQSLSLFIVAKMLAHWCTTQLPFVLLIPCITFLFQLSFSAALLLTVTLILGTPIIMLLCIFGISLSIGLRQQGLLISLMILPLSTPIIIFGVNIVEQFQAGFSVLGPISFLIALTLLSLTFFPTLIATVIKIGFDE